MHDAEPAVEFTLLLNKLFDALNRPFLSKGLIKRLDARILMFSQRHLNNLRAAGTKECDEATWAFFQCSHGRWTTGYTEVCKEIVTLPSGTLWL